MSVVYDQIYAIVQTIPKGRVLTYGLISHLIGGRMSAQGVGWALKALGSAKNPDGTDKKFVEKLIKPDPEVGLVSVFEMPEILLPKPSKPEPSQYHSGNVPWQRVVNSQGGTSTHKIPEIPPDLQKQLLLSEGIVFNDEDLIDLDKYIWWEGLPDGYKRAASEKAASNKTAGDKTAGDKTAGEKAAGGKAAGEKTISGKAAVKAAPKAAKPKSTTKSRTASETDGEQIERPEKVKVSAPR